FRERRLRHIHGYVEGSLRRSAHDERPVHFQSRNIQWGRRDTNTKQRTGRVAANTASRTYARSHRDFRFQYCTLVSVSGLDDVVRRLSISAADFKPSTASSGWFR